MTDRFGDKGYAFANVVPRTDIDAENRLVNVTYHAEKGPLVYIDRINISGNTKTRDKVIRREMKLAEGELYNGSAIRRSRQRIYNLSYFKEVDLATRRGSVEDRMDIDIAVEEGPTGTLSAGFGYSSVDGLVGMISVSQGNLFGRGQKLTLSAEGGGKSSNYSLSFTEPYLMDTRLTAGFDIFRNQRDYTDYDLLKKGWGLRAGHPIGEYSRISTKYRFSSVEMSNVSPTAPLYYQEYENTQTSSISLTLSRDSRDNYMNPTTGSDNSLYLEYAGDFLGGENYFYKTSVNSSWFFPALSDHVIMLHGRASFAEGLKGQELHPDERFFLGGINSLRGFDWREVGPREGDTYIGGNKELLMNVEYVFNIAKDAGLKGLFFYDTGNVYAEDEDYDTGALRSSAGYGFRWYSPVGPLRLEWGKVLDPEPGEKKSKWEFSIGTFF